MEENHWCHDERHHSKKNKAIHLRDLYPYKRSWKACHKPGSVLLVVITGLHPPTIEVTIIYLDYKLLYSSSDQPDAPQAKVAKGRLTFPLPAFY